jgi:hypothetical protein
MSFSYWIMFFDDAFVDRHQLKLPVAELAHDMSSDNRLHDGE